MVSQVIIIGKNADPFEGFYPHYPRTLAPHRIEDIAYGLLTQASHGRSLRLAEGGLEAPISYGLVNRRWSLIHVSHYAREEEGEKANKHGKRLPVLQI